MTVTFSGEWGVLLAGFALGLFVGLTVGFLLWCKVHGEIAARTLKSLKDEGFIRIGNSKD